MKLVVVENHYDGGMFFVMIMIFWKNYCGLGVKRLGHGILQPQQKSKGLSPIHTETVGTADEHLLQEATIFIMTDTVHKCSHTSY